MSLFRKTAAAGLTVLALASSCVTTSSPAAARGWGAPVAAGVIGGLAAGAILGSAVRPAYGYGYAPSYGYGYAPSYGYEAEPVYNPCYRSRTPVYDAYGNFAGYRPVRVCN